MKFNNIIFDFDGTLIDSRPGVVYSFKKVVKELANKQLNEEKIIQLIGLPLAQILNILLITNDEQVINKGMNLFKEYYQKAIHKNIVYPGTREMLESLKDQSCQLFIVSNKIEVFMEKILEQHNLKKYFVYVVGTDGRELQSNKPDQVKYLLMRFRLKKKETAMVGDTENDIMAGRKNFIFTIGAAWGYGSKFNLIKAKADKICHTPMELQQFIKRQ